MIRNIVLYLDRTYVIHLYERYSLMKAGLTKFKEIVIKSPEIHTRFIRDVLQLIEMDRFVSSSNIRRVNKLQTTTSSRIRSSQITR